MLPRVRRYVVPWRNRLAERITGISTDTIVRSLIEPPSHTDTIIADTQEFCHEPGSLGSLRRS